MKHVVAAIIVDDIKSNNPKFLLVQWNKHYEGFVDAWGFPAGKIEEGENSEIAMKREIHEELGLNLDVKYIKDVPGDVEGYLIHWYVAEHKNTNHFFDAREVKDAKWVTKKESEGMTLWPASRKIISELFKGESIQTTDFPIR